MSEEEVEEEDRVEQQLADTMSRITGAVLTDLQSCYYYRSTITLLIEKNKKRRKCM